MNNQFIEKAIEIHGNKYDYSKVIYINSKTPVIIICNVCNSEFEQIRNTHLTGNGGCKKCSKINFIKNRSFTKDRKEANSHLYPYQLVQVLRPYAKHDSEK